MLIYYRGFHRKGLSLAVMSSWIALTCNLGMKTTFYSKLDIRLDFYYEDLIFITEYENAYLKESKPSI